MIIKIINNKILLESESSKEGASINDLEKELIKNEVKYNRPKMFNLEIQIQEEICWISLDERRPRHSKKYLCLLRSRDMGGCLPYEEILYYDFLNKKWRYTYGERDYINDWIFVTHWAKLPPFPEPPK